MTMLTAFEKLLLLDWMFVKHSDSLSAYDSTTVEVFGSSCWDIF